jgi:hypothetical protein
MIAVLKSGGSWRCPVVERARVAIFSGHAEKLLFVSQSTQMPESFCIIPK